MTTRLDDTVVLVTGAGGGIGRTTTAALRAAGATVIATDLEPPQSEAALALAHDVTQRENWVRVADEIEARFGRLDALVNNAGIAVTEAVEATTLEAWRRVQAINVEGILLGAQTMLPLLRNGSPRRVGGASMVNLSSVAGLRGAAFNAAYCTSKASVAMLSKCLALEFAALDYGIRVNSVHPGSVETEMMDSILTRYVELGAVPSVERARTRAEARHPLRRFGRPEEVTEGILFLCGTGSSFMTGSELVIDGGYSAQ